MKNTVTKELKEKLVAEISSFLSKRHKEILAAYIFGSFVKAESFADTFRVMGEVEAFDSNFVDELTNMAKFRNRLVHLYWEVNERQLFEDGDPRMDGEFIGTQLVEVA